MHDSNASKPPVHTVSTLCVRQSPLHVWLLKSCFGSERTSWCLIAERLRLAASTVRPYFYVVIFLKSIKQKCFLRIRKCSLPQKKVYFPETHKHIPLQISFVSIFHIDKAQRAPPRLPSHFHHTAMHYCVWCVETRNQMWVCHNSLESKTGKHANVTLKRHCIS